MTTAAKPPTSKGRLLAFQLRRWSAALASTAALLFPASGFAARTLTPAVEPSSGVDIRMECWYESLPSHGFVPVTIQIRNGDTKPHTWTLRSHSTTGMGLGGLTSTTRIDVEAGQTGERALYVPVASRIGSGYYFGTLQFVLEGHGISAPSAGSLDHSGGYGPNRTEFIGMSKAVAIKHWGALKERLSSSPRTSTTQELHGSELDMTKAPDDWRGYAAMSQLWMVESDWLGMRPAAKAAMMDWVATGGRVYVLGSDASDAQADKLKLPPKAGKDRPHGAGQITLLPWENLVPLDQMAATVGQATSTVELFGNYKGKWGLRQLIGALTLKSGLIFGFIAIFGILIGPVNLFWLAPPGRRQRMFWTTPLLSLAGSLVLIAIMVLQDGIGGTGARMTLAILQPEQKRLAVIQEQVSRTGVMLGTSFSVTEPTWMQQLPLVHQSGYNPMEESIGHFAENENTRSGDWFSSRFVQAQYLQTVRPSRASIEVFPSSDGTSPPSVLSSIESPLKRVFVVDDNRIWTAEDVGTGEKKQMKPATRAEMDAWWNDGPNKLAGPVLKSTFSALMLVPAYVTAEVAEPTKLAMPTLSSIRWTNDRAFVAGPYLKH